MRFSRKNRFGIIPYKVVDGTLYFLLGHINVHSDGYWSLICGKGNRGEREIDSSVRSFKEETGLNVLGLSSEETLDFIGFVEQSSNRRIWAYSMDCTGIEIDISRLASEFTDGDCRWRVDSYRWMTYAEVKESTHPKLMVLYNTIVARKM